MSTALEWTSGRLWVVLGTLVTTIVGVTVRGDLLLIAVNLYKILQPGDVTPLEHHAAHAQSGQVGRVENRCTATAAGSSAEAIWQQDWYLENVGVMLCFSLLVTFTSYFSMGGFMQYYFYYRRKRQASEWKCQPHRWLSPRDERHEILLGSLNMAIGGSISGVIATYILNGGPCRLYYSALEKGLPYLLLSTVLLFLTQDALAYYIHRASHIPVLYKAYHKMHHRYVSPTAFSAVAMHPVEFLMYQCTFAAPLFFMPMYAGSFLLVVVYNYYYGMMDHSGVKMDAIWPWQPPTMFHDNHHSLFHVNFGFNTFIWDRMHDTLRKDSRVYSETIFGGRGVEKSATKTN